MLIPCSLTWVIVSTLLLITGNTHQSAAIVSLAWPATLRPPHPPAQQPIQKHNKQTFGDPTPHWLGLADAAQQEYFYEVSPLTVQTHPAHICVFRASPSPLEQHGCCQDLCPSEGALGKTVPQGVGEHHEEYLCFCIFPFRGVTDVVAADQKLPCPKRGTPCWLLEVGIIVHPKFCHK